jgi:phosphatidylserine/phosphatidylglycerophosphate/cardiolipin synthase-like enzyme
MSYSGSSAVPFNSSAYYQVCFTPAEKCSSRITHYINSAKKSIYIQAYSFTSKPISNALIKAKRHGVNVNVIIDKSELTNYSRVWSLLKAKVPVWLDKNVRIAHNKVMIFDSSAVLTGSYNFTYSAEHKNAENSLYIYDAGLAKFYLTNWQRRQKKSIRLSLKSANQWQKKLKIESQSRT